MKRSWAFPKTFEVKTLLLSWLGLFLFIILNFGIVSAESTDYCGPEHDFDADGVNETLNITIVSIESDECYVDSLGNNFVCRNVNPYVTKISVGLEGEDGLLDSLNLNNLTFILGDDSYIPASACYDDSSHGFVCEFQFESNVNFDFGFSIVYVANESNELCLKKAVGITIDNFAPNILQNNVIKNESWITVRIKSNEMLSYVKLNVTAPNDEEKEFEFSGEQIHYETPDASGYVYSSVEIDLGELPAETGNYKFTLLSAKDLLGNRKSLTIPKTIYLDLIKPTLESDYVFYYNGMMINDSTSIPDANQEIEIEMQFLLNETNDFTINLSIGKYNQIYDRNSYCRRSGEYWNCTLPFTLDLSEYETQIVEDFSLKVKDEFENTGTFEGTFVANLATLFFELTNISSECGRFLQIEGQHYYVIPPNCDVSHLELKLHFEPQDFVGGVHFIKFDDEGNIEFEQPLAKEGSWFKFTIDDYTNYTFTVLDNFENIKINNITLKVVKAISDDEGCFAMDENGLLCLKNFNVSSYLSDYELLMRIFYMNESNTNVLEESVLKGVYDGYIKIDRVELDGFCSDYISTVSLNFTPLTITPSEDLKALTRLSDKVFSSGTSYYNIGKNEHLETKLELVVDSGCGRIIVPIYNISLLEVSNETRTSCLRIVPNSGVSVPDLFVSRFSSGVEEIDNVFLLMYYFSVERKCGEDFNIYKAEVENCAIDDGSDTVSYLKLYSDGYGDPYFFLFSPIKFVNDNVTVRLGFYIKPQLIEDGSHFKLPSNFSVLCNLSFYVQDSERVYTDPISIPIVANYEVLESEDARLAFFQRINQTWHEMKEKRGFSINGMTNALRTLTKILLIVAKMQDLMINLDVVFNGACYLLCPMTAIPVVGTMILPAQKFIAALSQGTHLSELYFFSVVGPIANFMVYPYGFVGALWHYPRTFVEACSDFSSEDLRQRCIDAIGNEYINPFLFDIIKKAPSFLSKGPALDTTPFEEWFNDVESSWSSLVEDAGDVPWVGGFAEFWLDNFGNWIKYTFSELSFILKDLFFDPLSNARTAQDFLSLYGWFVNQGKLFQAQCNYLHCLVEKYNAFESPYECDLNYEIEKFKHESPNDFLGGGIWRTLYYFFLPMFSVRDYESMSGIEIFMNGLITYFIFGGLCDWGLGCDSDTRAEVFSEFLKTIFNHDRWAEYLFILYPELFNETFYSESHLSWLGPFNEDMSGEEVWGKGFIVFFLAGFIYGLYDVAEQLINWLFNDVLGFSCAGSLDDLECSFSGDNWVKQVGGAMLCDFLFNPILNSIKQSLREYVENLTSGKNATLEFRIDLDLQEQFKSTTSKIQSKISGCVIKGITDWFTDNIYNQLVENVMGEILKSATESLAGCGCGIEIENFAYLSKYQINQLTLTNYTARQLSNIIMDLVLKWSSGGLEAMIRGSNTSKCTGYDYSEDGLYGLKDALEDAGKKFVDSFLVSPSYQEKIKKDLELLAGLFGITEDIDLGIFTIHPRTDVSFVCDYIDNYDDFETFSSEVLS